MLGLSLLNFFVCGFFSVVGVKTEFQNFMYVPLNQQQHMPFLKRRFGLHFFI